MRLALVAVVLAPILLAGCGARAGSSVPTAAAASAEDPHLLARLRPHPRLLLTDERAARLRALVGRDPAARKAADEAIAEAERTVADDRTRFAPDAQLLGLGAQSHDRIVACGVAWRLTGRRAYADALHRLVLALCALPDWRTGDDFLGASRVIAAVGIGYDWLHATLTPDERTVIRCALLEKGLRPGLVAYGDGGAAPAWWVDTYINWNTVCNEGLITAALALADEEPELSGAVIRHAVASLPKSLATFAPDGAWPEGPGYGIFAALHATLAFDALDTAFGTDFGLSGSPGFAGTGLFALAACGPTRLFANIADTGERRLRPDLPALLWMARRYDRPQYARGQLDYLRTHAARALNLVWWPEQPPPPADLPLDQVFHGPMDLACLRGAWGDRDALFAWLKGGFNTVNHGHLDLGNFELDALGERWARDLGNDDYGLPGFFEAAPDGRRWSYYRENSLSHSVPLIDGANQAVDASAAIVASATGGSDPFAIVDLAAAYAPAATAARRGLMLVGRRAVLVEDEFTLARPCRLTWAMTTDAAITLAGDEATLAIGDRRLVARVLAPAGAAFSVESAEREPPEKRNQGVRRLLVELPDARGEARIAVLLSPRWDAGIAPAPALRPLALWTAE